MIRFRPAAVAAAVTLAVGLLFAPLHAQPAGKKVAVLIGVRSYRHAALPDLEFTERDVTELAKLLEPAGYKVTLLTTGSTAEKDRPTAANVRAALAAALKDVGKADTVLVALSGHGLQPDGSKESYFCPQDANPTFKDAGGGKVPARPDTLVGLTSLVGELNDSGVGVKLLLVDACRNDPTPGRGRNGIDGGAVAALPKGVAALFSCSAGQRAFETPKAGGGHGVFFHFVLEGLRGKAKNDRGDVTWGRLTEYVQENVEAKVPEWIGDFRQVPHEVRNLEGRSPALLAASVSLLPVDGGKHYVSKTTGMKFVRIPRGTFMMGSPKTELARRPSEIEHDATISNDFYMGVYEVTKGEFSQYATDTGNMTEAEAGDGAYGWLAGNEYPEKHKKCSWRNPGFPQSDSHPAVCISWNDAVKFAAWLSKKDGRQYRLPTEAEWEFACRGGVRTRYSFGDDQEDLAKYANIADVSAKRKYLQWNTIQSNDGYKFTAPVGRFNPNTFGLYDMHGNVSEWCADWKGDYPASHVTDPQGPAFGSFRVHRGGCYDSSPGDSRSAYRFQLDPSVCDSYVGFRLALVPSNR